MKTIILTGLVAFFALTAGAHGQSKGSFGVISGRSFGGPVYGGGGYGYYPFSSTVGEGLLRGSAAATRAAGEYNYYTSQALVNAEDARSKYIANREAALENYFQLKKMNANYQASVRDPRATPEQLARIAKMAAPHRLNSYQLEPMLGTINWPMTLKKPEFEAYRTRLNDLFAERSYENSGLGSENYKEVEYLTNNMEQDLRDMINQMTPAEYLTAKKFLTSLSYEAQFTPTTQGVALN